MGNKMEKKERNYGIDLLRIVSMFLIVLMHVLRQGGILFLQSRGTVTYAVLWFLEILAFCSVNSYALISGYVGYDKRFRLSRFTDLWKQVAFYTIGITIFYRIMAPETVNLKLWIKAFLPITSREYWYVTCYFGLLVFMPLLNAGINNLDKKIYQGILVLGVVGFSILPCMEKGYPFNFLEGTDPFSMLEGYSVLWLLFLYLLGAYIGKYGMPKLQATWKLVIIFMVSIGISFGWFLVSPSITVSLFGEERYQQILLNYTAPTTLFMACALCMLFSMIKIRSVLLQKLVRLLGGATLGVYLLHTHPLIWAYRLQDFMVGAKGNLGILLLQILLWTCVIYALGTVVDLVRAWIYRVLHIVKH